MSKALEAALKKHCRTRREAMAFVNRIFPKPNTLPVDDAREFLKEELKAARSKQLDVLIDKADKRGITYRTLRRAALELGVKSETHGFGPFRSARWRLK